MTTPVLPAKSTTTPAPAAPAARRPHWVRGAVVAAAGAAALTLAGVAGWSLPGAGHTGTHSAPAQADTAAGGAIGDRYVLTRAVDMGEPVADAVTPAAPGPGRGVARTPLPAGHVLSSGEVVDTLPARSGVTFVVTLRGDQYPTGIVYGQQVELIGASAQPQRVTVAGLHPTSDGAAALTLQAETSSITEKTINDTLTRTGDLHVIGLPL
jgi:hypothetical protein